jgi:hypothetical protein
LLQSQVVAETAEAQVEAVLAAAEVTNPATTLCLPAKAA